MIGIFRWSYFSFNIAQNEWIAKTFKDKGGEKNKNNKLMSLWRDDNKLWEKYKTIWTKIKDLVNIKNKKI